MKNRPVSNGHNPQRTSDPTLPLQIQSPQTVPDLETQMQRLQAVGQERGDQAAERRLVERQHADEAQSAQDNITRLEQALRDERARLAQAEANCGNAAARAKELEEAALAAIAQADDQRRLVAMLKPYAPAPAHIPAPPAPTGSTPPNGQPMPGPLDTGGYPTAPAQGR